MKTTSASDPPVDVSTLDLHVLYELKVQVDAEVLRRVVASAVTEHQCVRREDPDEETDVITLQEAACLMREPAGTVRRRLEYRRALVSRPGERRLRYSRHKLEEIRRDRLEASGMLSH